jgi:hypothetical protein
MQEAHEPIIHGHAGVFRTVELLSRWYYWPTLNQDVVKFVTTCALC